MQRCHIPSLDPESAHIELPGEEARHLVRVLRVRDGERIEALDGQGHIVRGPLRIEGARSASIQVDERLQAPAPGPRVTLFQALAKGEKMDWVVQKATELGVYAIQPVLTKRSVARPEEVRSARKQDRWQRVAINAIKQSGNPWLPQVEEVRSLADCLPRLASYDCSLAGAPESTLALRSTLQAARHKGAQRIACLVGPEGGFSGDELAALQSAGTQLVSLTPTILRTETAAVYFLSVLAYELGHP